MGRRWRGCKELSIDWIGRIGSCGIGVGCGAVECVLIFVCGKICVVFHGRRFGYGCGSRRDFHGYDLVAVVEVGVPEWVGAEKRWWPDCVGYRPSGR